ncbi:CRM-domain containing factor CFM3, chloroplastic/mitochondrial [Syzygium oleosum]|uniref:CRM-domain containing factor CFM3, chloroplastic/mitochondrial n=1 Tax=Syzygium oleosum TaxID=219896 RepID=UPI0024B93757|nr:CRM-domain containing factor CFM3, chloroplastic/mitochondrial [Syzygium oleosum]XP_056176921.1 CRM-domain containing factor CFM3, chloroplastic/mitochondrial [Syzygium oleosum]
MALAPFPPPNPSYPPPARARALARPPPLRLLLLRRSCEVVRFRTRCSDRPVQFEARPTRVPFDAGRKKRKRRPSFFEEIRGKWTSKTGSARERFPWQVEEREPPREQCEDESLVSREASDEAVEVSSERERDVESPVTDGVMAHAVSVNQSRLPPWLVHGYNKPSPEPIRDDESEASRSGSEGEEIEEVRERLGDGNVVRAGESISEVDFGGEFDTEDDEWEKLSPVPRQGENLSLAFGGLRVSDFLSDDENHQGNDELEKLDVSGESGNKGSVDLPWKSGERKQSNVDLAERVLPQHELRRLRKIALRMVERKKVGDAGITQALVDSIHEKWRVDEVVKLKFEGALSLNMKRTHQILESRTGGLVIWRSGSSVVLYRGMAYKLPCVQSYSKKIQASVSSLKNEDIASNVFHSEGGMEFSKNKGRILCGSAEYMKDLSKEEFMDMNDPNDLLDELGPRFKDWSGCDPVPVDADLLSSEVPGYKTPFRLLAYGVGHCLRNKEMTMFRRLARTMPPHFALGRNRRLQGLAKAMVKLWESSAIAKIAIKRGVPNTCNDRMAEELKNLTGGTLLSRNKDYIVFYRGNDFMPPAVVEALKERAKLADVQANEEDQARQRASAAIDSKLKASKSQLVAGTLTETLAATSRWGNELSSKDFEQMRREESLNKHASLLKYLEKKLALAKGKVKKAEKALAKVQENLRPADLPVDLETISDEERSLLRKIGLSMKPFLLIGKRAIFDGTIENVHLHWKYRELVKLIVRGKSFAQVKHLAISLEAESGGVLVSVDKTMKGYAIIIYRGKNYQRPRAVRPRNLLTRRQALARSIELQRREALKHHLSDLQERIEQLKYELEDMRVNNQIDEEKLSRSLNAGSTIDDTSEDEGEEAYLGVYDSGVEDA